MVKTIRIKESVEIVQETDDIYRIILSSTRMEYRFKVDSLVKSLISSLEQEQVFDSLINELSQQYDPLDIRSAIATLENSGVLRVRDDFFVNDRNRRQLYFIDELTSSWDESQKLQRRIENSTVAVFGVGGIGTWMVNGLYQMNIGEIRIVDPDKIDLTNINRQLFFTSQDVGKYKVDVLVEKLPDAKIKQFKRLVNNEESLDDIISGSDFVINCTDSPSVEYTTKIIDAYAKKFNVPYCISGGYNLHLGLIGPIIIPGKTATFEDYIRYQRENDPLQSFEQIKTIEQSGNIGPIAGAVANIQLMEIFKHIIQKGNINYNKFGEINFMNFEICWKDFSKK